LWIMIRMCIFIWWRAFVTINDVPLQWIMGLHGGIVYGYKSNTVQHTIGQELPSHITYFDSLLTFFGYLPNTFFAHSWSLVGWT
jgi:hypothetical protein